MVCKYKNMKKKQDIQMSLFIVGYSASVKRLSFLYYTIIRPMHSEACPKITVCVCVCVYIYIYIYIYII